MKFSTNKPPCYDRLASVFPIDWDSGIAITYKDTIYSKHPLPLHKIVHEQVHLEQQKGVVDESFVDKYITDPAFRLEMELQAYRTERDWIKINVKDRNLKVKMIDQIYKDLSLPIYGDIIKYSDAKRLLQ